MPGIVLGLGFESPWDVPGSYACSTMESPSWTPLKINYMYIVGTLISSHQKVSYLLRCPHICIVCRYTACVGITASLRAG